MNFRAVRFCLTLTLLGIDLFSPSGYNFSTFEELDQFIRRENQEYFCSICLGFRHKSTASIRNHLESKHFNGKFSHPCPHCPAILNTRKALENHRRKCILKNPLA